MIESIERRSPMTMYYQLMQALCQRIRQEGMRPGDRLPSVRELIRDYRVSLPVVRQAVAELEREGIVRVEQGRGTYVLRLPSEPPSQPGRLRTVLFVSCSHDVVDPYYSRVLHGVQDEAGGNGYQVVYAHPVPSRPLAQLLTEVQAAGVILTGRITTTEVDEVMGRGLTCVVAGEVEGRPSLPKGLTSVVNDDFEGGYLAGRHLVELGHRRIGAISGPPQFAFWRRRLDGLRQALLEVGGDLPESRIVYLEQERPGEGARGAAELFAQDEPPTAVFACNDRFAYGVYAHLQAQGLRVPEACSLVGFDDLTLSAELAPGLTTIHPDIEALGRRAMQAMLARESEPPTDCERIIIPVKLIARGSTAPCTNTTD